MCRPVPANLRHAFTLVEILIVVVILGILAAIVTPQFATATQDSKAGSIKSQLGTLQRQIELFQAKNSAWPDFAADQWGDSASPATLIGGNYIKLAPVNPAWPQASDPARYAIATTTGAGERGSATAGWLWNQIDHTLYASYFDETTGLVTGIPED